MRTLVEVRNLSRSFDKVKAVNTVSFSLAAGTVTGFVGANGSGKTTTMRMLVGLDIPDEGEVLIDGKSILQRGREVVQLIGWMPDSYATYPKMSAKEYLTFFALAYGLRNPELEQRVRAIMDFTELTPIADRNSDGFSKGQKQRLCLARALLPDPFLLILDEPAAGLDPKARIEFKHLVRLLAQRGKTILISSHILTELESMCDSFLFINNGTIVHHGDSGALKRGSTHHIEATILLHEGHEEFRLWCEVQPHISVTEQLGDGFRVALTNVTSDRDKSSVERGLSGLLRRTIEAGFPVYEFRSHERNLEDAFVDIVTKHAADQDEE